MPWVPNPVPMDVPESAALTDAEAAQAREWFRWRTMIAIRGIALVAFVSAIIDYRFLLVWVPAIIVYWLRDRWLLASGVLVPANAISHMGDIRAFKSGGEAWTGSNPGKDYGASDAGIATTAVHGGVNFITLTLGRWVPCVITGYQFELNAKVYRVAKYMMTHEQFFTSEAGCLWALVHPKHPRLNSWLVSIPPG